MRNKSSKIYNSFIHCSYVFLLSLVLFGCQQESNTEIVEIDDIIPEAKGNYEYVDSSSTEKVILDQISTSLINTFGKAYEPLDSKTEKFKNSWTFIPDRVETDSSFNKLFKLDSTIIQLKSWYFNDSLRTINALYNWLDCFGNECKAISIGDSTNVSTGSFILLQDNTQIHFIRSEENVNFQDWKKFFKKNSTINGSWNYILQQRKKGVIGWTIVKKEK